MALSSMLKVPRAMPRLARLSPSPGPNSGADSSSSGNRESKSSVEVACVEIDGAAGLDQAGDGDGIEWTAGGAATQIGVRGDQGQGRLDIGYPPDLAIRSIYMTHDQSRGSSR